MPSRGARPSDRERSRAGRRIAAALAGVMALLSATAPPVPAQPASLVEPPPLQEGVLTRIGLEYLSDDERADLRIFHGLWREADLASPARRARAALIVGAYDDPSFSDASVPAEDRAEAAVARGDLDEALALLAGQASLRAQRLRAEALEGLGRFPEADAAIDPVVATLTRETRRSAEDLVEGVRALRIRARVRGQPAQDYERMMQLLATARQTLDRFYWPAILTEAELLFEKDNDREGVAAASEVLRLNPVCVRAWGLLAEHTVRTFDFDRTEAIAARMTQAVRRIAGFSGADETGPTSAPADLALARAALRLNDPELAGERVARVLRRFPAMREALSLEAAVVSLGYDWDALEEALKKFDALSPKSPAALYAVGAALSEARQYSEAAEYLNRAIERQPNWPAPVIELGLLEMQSGRDDAARLALKRAVELDPFNVRAGNSLTLINELLTYEEIESDHFIVRYKPGVDRVMAADMLAPLEEIHRIVSTAIDHEPAVKTVIEVMPDHEWFAVRITGMPGIHTVAACTGPLIAMEVPRQGKKHLGLYDWVRTVRHEYTHTVTLSRTKNRIPHWFTEAAAVYVEGAPRDLSRCELLVGALVNHELFDMRRINTAFVRPEKPTDRAQAYAQGHWMYEFIVQRWGGRAPLDLMDLYAKGIREDEAMTSVLGLSQQDFHNAFVEWAWQDAAKWGMLPRPSLNELRLEETMLDSELRDAAGATLRRLAAAAAARIAFAGSRPCVNEPEAGENGGAADAFRPRRLGGRPAPFEEDVGWLDFEFDLAQVTPQLVDYWYAAHPDHPDVLELKILQDLEQAGGSATPEMIPLLERYAAARPVDPMPHRHLARLYLDQDNAAEAVPHLEYLDEREGYSPAYASELARRYAALGELDKAWARAERATTIAPFDPSLRELAATVALQRQDPRSAERHIAALVELEPQQEIHKRRLEAVRKMLAGGSTAPGK